MASSQTKSHVAWRRPWFEVGLTLLGGESCAFVLPDVGDEPLAVLLLQGVNPLQAIYEWALSVWLLIAMNFVVVALTLTALTSPRAE